MEETGMEQTGGKLIASGQYGCVFVPTLKVKQSVDHLPRNDMVEKGLHVDKLMEAQEANLEFSTAKSVQRIPHWKSYYLVAESMFVPSRKQKEKEIKDCEPIGDEKLEQLRILRMMYGGTPLNKYTMRFHSFEFNTFVMHLLEAVALLTLHGITHTDLHSGNILVDNKNRPRIIDFNLSVDSRTKGTILNRLSHLYEPSLMQEPPDSVLVTAEFRRNEGDIVPDSLTVIEEILKKKTILRTAQAVLGMTEREQRKGMMEFLTTSKAAQNGDLELWFRTYWRVNDSWAIAANIIIIISRMMLFKAFDDRWGAEVQRISGTLKKMLRTNPRTRYDSVQALYELYPESPFFTNPDYKDIHNLIKAWLEQVNAVRPA